MEEIEVKILEINVKEVQQKLKKLGAKKVFEGEVIALYFDFPDKRMIKNGKLVRLRKKGDEIEFVIKEKISKEEAKIMKEHEVKITDFEEMSRILGLLGLQRYKSAQKHRITYVLEKVHFEFDTLPGIPTFLEIEAPTLGKVKEVAGKLGFSMEDCKPWSGGDVLRHYGKP
jgi:adenylate cyclase, class 2